MRPKSHLHIRQLYYLILTVHCTAPLSYTQGGSISTVNPDDYDKYLLGVDPQTAAGKGHYSLYGAHARVWLALLPV